MLQQTQVKTVIPYWERWMRELPTIESLAKAKPQKIHKLWEGLGYYTRVRNMQKAAQEILKSGKRKVQSGNSICLFPENFEELLALPGIGRYTAGAIASIAFNQPTPILDGNVIRVLTRLHGMGDDPRDKKTNAQLWLLAEALVLHASRITHHEARSKSRTRTRTKDEEDQNCSALNQSLMELGAIVCTPRSPDCAACPVANHCFARRMNRVEDFPRPKARAVVTQRRFIAMIVERDGKFLLHQRPAGTVNAQLWEFPTIEAGNGSDPSFTRTGQPLCAIKHSITRYRITTEAWRVAADELPPHVAGVWRSRGQLEKLPFTSAHRRIAAQLLAVNNRL